MHGDLIIRGGRGIPLTDCSPSHSCGCARTKISNHMIFIPIIQFFFLLILIFKNPSPFWGIWNKDFVVPLIIQRSNYYHFCVDPKPEQIGFPNDIVIWSSCSFSWYWWSLFIIFFSYWFQKHRSIFYKVII